MFRKILFWSHLLAGITAGVAIAIMCATGAVLTYEKELVAWAERDARRVTPPAEAKPLALDALLQRALAARPDLRVNSVAVSADPRDAVMLNLPGNTFVGANPYTGELRDPSAPRMRAFMQAMRAWHLRLNFRQGPGNAGAQINSAANLLFVFLGVSGLVLWWPRSWQWRALRPSVWFTSARGRARDWNWHNVIGIWTLPLLLVLAGTGVVLSYRWANQLVFRLAGETPPANLAPPPPPRLALPPPPDGAAPLAAPALVAAVQRAYPDWALVTLRFQPALTAAAAPATPRTQTLAVRERRPWPRFNQPVVTLDAYSGAIVRTEGYATLSPGLQARRWIRLLHSAEALGPFVQLLSGLACLGGCVLVYTGFALAWRRWQGRARREDPAA